MEEVWNRKYEPSPIRDGDQFDPMIPIDLCAFGAPGAHGKPAATSCERRYSASTHERPRKAVKRVCVGKIIGCLPATEIVSESRVGNGTFFESAVLR